MKLTAKLPIGLILALLIIPNVLIQGCGKALNGNATGGCPDSTAPAGFKISGPDSLGAPSASGGSCFPNLVFTVLDEKGAPANGICVELYSNGNIALHSGNPDCSDVSANPSTSIVTRSDSSGHIPIALMTLPTTAGETFFVEAQSGAATFIATTEAAK